VNVRNHNETVALFLATRCKRDEHTNTTIADLTAAFNAWAAGSDEPPMSSKALTVALRARGVDTGRNKNARYYVGVGLSTAVGVTHVDLPPTSLGEWRDMTILRTEDEASRLDAKHRLVELIQARRRLYVDARFDPELRAELDSVDCEILAAERELSR
jgi:hypothetical protein